MKNLSLLALLFLLVFSACRKDTDLTEITETMPDPPIIQEWEQRIENITGDLRGVVVDQNDALVIGATVTLNGNSTTTDDYGHFFFADTEMNAKGAYLTVQKDGFFEGSRRFFPQANAESRVKVELLPMNFATEFSALTGGAYTFEDDGVQLIFPENAVINEATGETYNGTVAVAAVYLDPNDADIYDRMPGNLQGINTAADEVVLQTVGMMAVELRGENGEELNLAEGKTATVSVPVPDGVTADEVPLWSFDEAIGMWIEEGTATLQNGVYVGEVSHFSFWNWDFDLPSADLTINLTDSNGNPVVNTQINVISETIGTGGYGYTNDAGSDSGMVPAGEVLTVVILSQCGSELLNVEIGPFAEGSNNTETFVVDAPEINSTTITGTVVDCDGAPAVNSLVIVDYDGGPTQYIYTDEGSFNTLATFCNAPATATLTAVDLNNLVQSSDTEIVIGGTNDLGAVSACDQAVEENILTVTIDGVTQSYLVTNVNASAASTDISVNTDSVGIFIGFIGAGAGDYGGNLNYIEIIQDQNLGWSYGAANQNQGGFENFTITNYTDTNISGTFSGEVVSFQTGNTTTAEGTFSVVPE